MAYPGQLPYQVGISFYWNGYGWFCGASLISEWEVLTAAHCTDGADEADIYAGCIFLNSGVKVSVSEENFKQHKEFNRNRLTNDISLIRLKEKLNFGLLINKIGLPSLNGTHDAYVGQKARASGWGVTADNATSLPCALQYADLDVISNEDCGPAYPGYIKKSHICTSVVGGKSTCSGDSGGALAINSKTKPVQIGIVSFGSSRGCTEEPSVYTRVTEYLDWIKKNTGISY